MKKQVLTLLTSAMMLASPIAVLAQGETASTNMPIDSVYRLEDKSFTGLPAELQGTYTINNQSVQITGQQITYRDKVYDVTGYAHTKISDKLDRYTIYWDFNKFKERYPEVDVPGPQAFNFDLDKVNKTLIESGVPVNPDTGNQVVSKSASDQTTEAPASTDKSFAGLPAEIQGKYTLGNESFDISSQQITYNGEIYDVESYMVQKVSDQIDRYSVVWKVDKFKERYPGKEVPGPQAISFDFDKTSKTIVSTGTPALPPEAKNQQDAPAANASKQTPAPASDQKKASQAAGDQKKAGNLAADQKKTQQTQDQKKTADPQRNNILKLFPRTGASFSILLVVLGLSALGLGIGLSKRQ